MGGGPHTPASKGRDGAGLCSLCVQLQDLALCGSLPPVLERIPSVSVSDRRLAHRRRVALLFGGRLPTGASVLLLHRHSGWSRTRTRVRPPGTTTRPANRSRSGVL